MTTAQRLAASRLSAASPSDPLRVLFSACLLGAATGWDGEAYPEPLALRLRKLPNVRAVSFCPEDVSLGTPRPLTTLYGGNGRDVLAGRARVLDTEQRDVTAPLKEGAHQMAAVAERERVELAVLLDVSDSCGSNVVYLGDPTERRYQKGEGVAAALLRRKGIPIVAQRDTASLQAIVAALDPTFVIDPVAFDFVDHPWYRAYFADGDVGLPLAEFERKQAALEDGASANDGS